MREYSFSELSSDEFRDQIIKDMDYLLDSASSKKLKPVILSVGILFVEVGIIQSILVDLDMECGGSTSFEDNVNLILALFKAKRSMLYRDCEGRSGQFGRDDERDIDIYFDPEEPYMSLSCVDKNKSGGNTDLKTADGYPYYRLKFKPEEVLVEFEVDQYN